MIMFFSLSNRATTPPSAFVDLVALSTTLARTLFNSSSEVTPSRPHTPLNLQLPYMLLV